ncbi:MAG TPA: glycosyltransferase family 4 protein [Terriglobales bacterium]|nr:glycosyltransferase family 4 protein [Terriglobales bacterium]
MKWICCQLGAREHYAIPRALLSRGLLGCLLTDAWVPPSSFLAKISAAGLADRFHNDLSDARVIAFNLSVIFFEMRARARRLAEWERIIARNQWFQRKVVGALNSQLSTLSSQAILLSYSYAALEPFRFAKLHGWKTLLLQIDPGPEEERIVAEEVARVSASAGAWQAAPVAYWASWRQECDLADRIIVNSEWSREGLMRSGVPDGKLTLIPLAYEASEVGDQKTEIRQVRSYPARFTRDRPMRVLFLGQVNLRKGVARLLQAAQTLRDEPVEFWIVGPVRIANAETAADNARVKWFGPVTRKETAEKYRAADVFILPTLSDGFAITQLEAQAYGLPVISSKCCGGVVENGRNGIILEEPSAECIAAAIRDCVADPRRLQTLAAASYRQNEFTTDVLGQRLQNLGSKL